MNKVYLTRSFTFEAAHHLPNYEGKCNYEHGHSYRLDVTVSGLIDTYGFEYGDRAACFMVIDFTDLKKIVGEHILNTHDHVDLNDTYGCPTAEVMVVSIYDRIEDALPVSVKLESVKLWETSDCCAEYKGKGVDV